MRRETIFATCLVVVLCVVWGCGKFQGLYTADPLTVQADKNKAAGGLTESELKSNPDTPNYAPMNLDNACFEGIGDCNGTSGPPIVKNANSSKDFRNHLSDHLIGLSNKICFQHKAKIQANGAAINTFATGLATTLGGIGALVEGATAARILSGSASLVNAGQSNINENIYQNQVIPAVITQIDKQRTAKLQEIESHNGEDPAIYSVQHMLRDVEEYHNLCSFAAALANLGNNTKRPLTADEIRGKIKLLSDEIKSNEDLASKLTDVSTKTAIIESNKTLVQKITALQGSLARGVAEEGPAATGSGGTKEGEKSKSSSEANATRS